MWRYFMFVRWCGRAIQFWFFRNRPRSEGMNIARICYSSLFWLVCHQYLVDSDKITFVFFFLFYVFIVFVLSLCRFVTLFVRTTLAITFEVHKIASSTLVYELLGWNSFSMRHRRVKNKNKKPTWVRQNKTNAGVRRIMRQSRIGPELVYIL